MLINLIWANLASHWRITIGVIVLSAIILATHHYDNLHLQASQESALKRAVALHLNQEKQSETIGMDLEYGLNQYRQVTRNKPAGGQPLTPDELQRINARIAAASTSFRGND